MGQDQEHNFSIKSFYFLGTLQDLLETRPVQKITRRTCRCITSLSISSCVLFSTIVANAFVWLITVWNGSALFSFYFRLWKFYNAPITLLSLCLISTHFLSTQKVFRGSDSQRFQFWRYDNRGPWCQQILLYLEDFFTILYNTWMSEERLNCLLVLKIPSRHNE